MENKMKPFNLQDALAGKPVITRDGKKVFEIVHLSSMKNERNILAIFENDCMLYRHDGTCMLNLGDSHSSDLFMAAEKKSIWINIFESIENGELFTDGFSYSSYVNATFIGSETKHKYIKTIEITNEL